MCMSFCEIMLNDAEKDKLKLKDFSSFDRSF